MMRFIASLMLFPLLLLTAVSVPAEMMDAGGRAYFDYAVFAFEEGDYQAAEKNLDIALHFSPDHPDYLYYLGKVYMETERYAEAFGAFEKAFAADETVPGLAFDRAMLSYRTGAYEAAARGFKAVAESSSKDVYALYYAGLSSARISDCPAARSFLEKAGDISPTLKMQAKIVTGNCITAFGEKEGGAGLSVASDEAAQEMLLPGAVRMPPWRLHLSMNRGYDDNVRLIPEDLEVSADEGDWATGVAFSGTYDFYDRNPLKLGGGFDYIHTRYDDLPEFEQNGAVLRLYAGYEQRPFRYGFNYLLFYHWFDGDSALRRHRLGPDVTWEITRDFSARLAYAFYDNGDFLDDGRDGNTHKVFMNVFYRLPNRRGRLLAGMGYEIDSASDDWKSFDRIKLSAGGMLRLPWKLELEATAHYADVKYDSADPDYNVERDDDKYGITVGLFRLIWKDWLKMKAEYGYTQNDSNILDREYEQNRFGVSLEANF